MSYDLFISYSRRDNAHGRISELVERIKTDFAAFAGRALQPFFDLTEIHGMEDWRHRILQGLRESRLLLACLSPAYIESDYCQWEFTEYLKHEVARLCVGEGVAGVYFVEVPGWEDKGFEQRCAAWVAELRRRQHFDLRPWYGAGVAALRDAAVQEQMARLNEQLAERVRRGERAEGSLGNVDAPNPHFIGRVGEMRRLREALALGRVGVLAAVHGLGGVGKTALAIEYAHAFAHEYGGGRWQLRCSGRDDLCAAVAELATPLGVAFTEPERLSVDLQFQRILAELRRLADAREPHRCLLILDNVDQPKLLEPAQTQRLPAADWLHVLATTRLGENEMFGRHQDRAFLPVDELPEEDALTLIESYQPGGRFASDAEWHAAREIVRLLGCFTLAVEAAAVYLGQFAGDVTCAAFLARLKGEGLEGLDAAAGQSSEGVLHGEKRLAATLRPTLERLSEPEKLALSYAALLPPDHVALPWLRSLMASESARLGEGEAPAEPQSGEGEAPAEPRSGEGEAPAEPRSGEGEAPAEPRSGEGEAPAEPQSGEGEAPAEPQSGEGEAPAEPRSGSAGASPSPPRRGGFPDFGRDAEPGYPDPWRDLLRGLFSLRLLQPTGVADADGFPLTARIHRIVQDLVRRGLSPDQLAARQQAIEGLVQQRAAALEATTRWEEARWELDPLDALGKLWADAQLPRAAWLLSQVGARWHHLAEWTRAEPLLRGALAIDEESFGKGHPRVATDLNNLAALLQATNRLAETEPLLRRVVEIMENGLGPGHPNVAPALNNLAALLQVTNRLAEAEPLLRRALAMDEANFGKDHPKVAIRLNNLALLLQATNRLAEAEPLSRRQLDIILQFTRATGHPHPNLQVAASNYAGLLIQMGRSREEALAQLNAVTAPFGIRFGG